MARRIIDLSTTLDPAVKADPPQMHPEIDYHAHADTAPMMAAYFDGLTREDLPGGEGWAVETMRLSTHNGTHLDAPYHHHSTMNGGERAITIDEMPLDWCFRPGVKLDMREVPDGEIVSAIEVELELARIGHELQPLDIVLVNTSAGEAYGRDDYVHRGCGMGRAATMFLLEKGVRITGTDAWSWDAPFSHTAKEWEENRDPSIIWEGHRASIDIGYGHIEKMANLDQLPATGFTVACFPFKIKGASAGFTRAVAILDD